jgi:eukaryotic-like serine/threonine-protein kinase
VPGSSHEVAALMIGTTIDRFRVLSRLGQGGMGSVWKAEDTLLHRPVALKLLADDLAESPQARLRFLREARAASSLSHPCVATVYGAGESGPYVFIALALIEGETIAECAAREPFHVADVVRLGIAVAEALAHAHSRGVIHRDITGRNIMIDREGRVFVLDFGLAMMVNRTRLTTSTTTMGTAAYMAPEVALGRDADPRADLYGLGVVLYEALTGTLPFRHERAEGMLYAAVHQTPDPPSTRREGVPASLDRIVLSLLEKTPEARPANADELIAELRALAGVESGVRVGHALVVTGSGPRPAVVIRDHAVVVTPFRDLSDAGSGGDAQGHLAAGLSDVVRAALAQVPGLDVISLQGADWIREPALARGQVSALGARMLLGGSVRRMGSNVRLTYTLTDVSNGATVAGETCDGSTDDLFALEDHLVGSVLAALKVGARPVRAGGRRLRDAESHQSFLKAISFLQQTNDLAKVDAAIELLEELRTKQPDSATLHAALGRAYGRKYSLRSDREWEIKAAESCQRALDLDPHAPEVFATLGDLHVSTGRTSDAIRAFEQAIELRPEYAEAWSGISLAYLRANRFADAEEACRRVIALRPSDWIGYNRLGIVFFRQGRFASAVEPWRMVTRLAPENSVGHLNLAGAYFNTDRWDESAAEYRRSLTIKPTADAWSGLGSVLYYRGEYEDSFEAFENAIQLSPRDARFWGNLASACDCLPARAARGAEALDRAIALMLDRLEINPNSAEDWALLAKWRGDRGQHEPARTAIERAIALAPEDASVMGEAVLVYHALGDRPNALHWLGEAVARGFGTEVLERNPALIALREDPDFSRIIEERSATSAERAQFTSPPKGRP